MLFSGAKPVPPPTNSRGRCDSSSRMKLPSGPSMRSSAFSFISLKAASEKRPAGDLLHVQHQVLVVVRRVGQRIAASLAALQKDVEELASQELQALGRRELQAQFDHVGRQQA
jgi:hypothetical protein